VGLTVHSVECPLCASVVHETCVAKFEGELHGQARFPNCTSRVVMQLWIVCVCLSAPEAEGKQSCKTVTAVPGSTLVHQWSRGNLDTGCECAVCGSSCASNMYDPMGGLQCMWCRVTVHDTCSVKIQQSCVTHMQLARVRATHPARCASWRSRLQSSDSCSLEAVSACLLLLGFTCAAYPSSSSCLCLCPCPRLFFHQAASNPA
jgi:hypothetical protein